MRKGIDVSYHQGTIDWAKVAKSGVEFAIIRAGYGRLSTQEDKQFRNNYENAKAHGISLGTYWFCYAEDLTGAKQEAEACIKTLKGRTFEYPVFFDIEKENLESATRKKLNTDMCIAFCEALSKAGYQTGVYANKNWWNHFLDYAQIKQQGHTIWCAEYNRKMTFGQAVDIWQYTSSGSIDGISGNVDMNYCYMDMEVGSETETKPDKSEEQGLAAGRNVLLKETNLYSSSTAQTASRILNGSYYIWSSEVVNSRIRITNEISHVGMAGQVTGWVDKTDCT